jgi:predicted Abi (CAAX) family protease
MQLTRVGLTLKPIVVSRHLLLTANMSITDKLHYATTSAVSVESIAWTAGLIGSMCILAIPFGFQTGFFVFHRDISWRHTILLSIRLLIVPSTLEEYLWRVILQPYPTGSSTMGMRVFFCTMSTLAFVAAHPLLANTIWTRGMYVFGDWRFLFLALLLGTACTLAYQLSGSVWMPVVVHWIAVVAWIAFLGGEEKLTGGGNTTNHQRGEENNGGSSTRS